LTQSDITTELSQVTREQSSFPAFSYKSQNSFKANTRTSHSLNKSLPNISLGITGSLCCNVLHATFATSKDGNGNGKEPENTDSSKDKESETPTLLSETDADANKTKETASTDGEEKRKSVSSKPIGIMCPSCGSPCVKVNTVGKEALFTCLF